MTTIYLIRHAEAEGNLFRRAQGHWNGKITARGKKQIDALAERFKDVQLDAVYSSDLDRARETAGALLRGRDLELHTTRAAARDTHGRLGGRQLGQPQLPAGPSRCTSSTTTRSSWHVPGCESFEPCRARMTRRMTSIAAENEGRTVGVVAHGMCIKIFLMGVLGIHSGDREAMLHGDNTSVSLLAMRTGGFAVEYYNDNSHLGELSTFAQQQWWRDTTKDDPTSLRFAPLNPRDKAGGRLLHPLLPRLLGRGPRLGRRLHEQRLPLRARAATPPGTREPAEGPLRRRRPSASWSSTPSAARRRTAAG